MTIKRVSVASSFDPNNEEDSVIYPGTTSTNVFYCKYPNGDVYATQRPAFQISQNPSNSLASTDAGRGIYFWEGTNTFVIVNYDQVEFGYGSSIGTISAGKDRVFFVETPEYLVILDPENNEGWTIDVTSPVSVDAISDTDFPPNQTPALSLAGGGAFLDGYLFVMTTDGNIWNSNLNDATAWTAIDFVQASREADRGVYITKHHDNIVAVGSQTIEFFYDEGNDTGSPLGRRQDISYRNGCPDYKSIFTAGDIITMISSDRKSTNAIYMLDNFNLTKVSSFSIDSAISSLSLQYKYEFIVCSGMLNDHFLTFVTAVDDAGTTWTPIYSFIHDSTTNAWTRFQVDIDSLTEFPVMDIADKIFNKETNIEMLMLNSYVYEISGNMRPLDLESNGTYFLDSDYLVDQTSTDPDDATAYLYSPENTGEAGIAMTIVTMEEDFGTYTNKFLHSLWVVGTVIANTNTSSTTEIDISWTDDSYNTFSTARSLSVLEDRKLTRLGKFKDRAFKLEYSGPNQLRITGLDLDAGVASYA